MKQKAAVSINDAGLAPLLPHHRNRSANLLSSVVVVVVDRAVSPRDASRFITVAPRLFSEFIIL